MDSAHPVVDQILKEVWPKGLVGLLVPAVQFAWKLYRDRGPEHQRKALRLEVTELRKFLESLSSTDESPETEASRQAARTELDEKVAAFAALAAPTRTKPGVAAAPPPRMPPAPAPAAPATFPPEMTTLPSATPVPASSMGGWFGRWFLFYTPSRGLAWLAHTLFFVSLTGLLLTVPVAFAEARKDPEIIAAPVAWLVLTLLFRAWAGLLESGDSYGLRRLLLLYAPSQPIGWLPRGLFYISLLATSMVAIALPFLLLSPETRDHEVILAMVFGATLWLVLTLLFRAWAVALDPQPSDPSRQPVGLRRWLLLYIPSRPAVFILHVLFYFGPVIFYIALDTYFLSPTERVIQIDPAGQTVDMQASLALPLVYLVLAILIIRDWAASFHPAGDGARKRLRWLFLGRTSKRVGYIPRILYYVVAFWLPLAIFALFEDQVHGGLSLAAPFHAWNYCLWVTLPCTMVAISARGWARSLDAAAAPQPAAGGFADRIRKALLLDVQPDWQVWLVRSDLGLVLLLLILAARQSEAVEPLRLVLTVGFVLLAAVGWAASLRRIAL